MKILINITHGPEHPTRAALGFLIGRMAVDEGHEVTFFLAGDAVQLIRDPVLDSLGGLGTGNLRESFDGAVAGGARIFLSRMSSQARGVADADLEGKPAELVPPTVLVQLVTEHDRVLTY